MSFLNNMRNKIILLLIITILLPASVFAEDPVVYITKTGSKYHLESCSSLRDSGIPIRLSDAVAQGYEACKRCNPPVSAAQNDYEAFGIEELALPFCERPEEIIHHEGYSLLYSEEHEQAYWVAYLLTDRELQGGFERTDNFREDPAVITGSAGLSDYRKSGYDRGHLAPAADLCWSAEAMSDSFYLSNMSPQAPGFNRGIWKELESWVREKASDNFELYVVSGPVLTAGPYRKIGQNNVSVPEYYYKVILDYYGPEKKAIGFIMPNSKSDSGLTAFSVPVDTVEKATGLDFFFMLSDEIEDSLESSADFQQW